MSKTLISTSGLPGQSLGPKKTLITNINGKDGKPGEDAYQIAVENGFEGTEIEWLESLEGLDGTDAYSLALLEGFIGTRAEWLASLKGKDAGINRSEIQELDAETLREAKEHADNLKVTWENLEDKPDSFTPSSHAHAITDVDDLEQALEDKSNVGHKHTFSDISESPEIPKLVDVQIFEPSGGFGTQTSFVWTRPEGAKHIHIVAVGGGGGGGGGRQGAPGSIRTGGGGGAAGQVSELYGPASTFPSTLNLVVGNGGAGGSSAITQDTNGGNAGTPAQTSVRLPDNSITILGGYQGSSGSGGSQAVANGGSTPNYSNIASGGPTAGSSPAGGGPGGFTAINDTSRWAHSGGAGGGIPTTNIPQTGGGGNRNVSGGGGFPNATPINASASDAINGQPFSYAAGGGGSSIIGPGGNGGNGGKYGGGGGGGGASTNGHPSGKGGNGGPGAVIITTWF